MKLKNKMNDIRAIRDNGKDIEVGPGKIIEVEKPSKYNPNIFEKIEKDEKKTLGVVEKEKLKKESK